MKKNLETTNLKREIKSSFSRFISILLMVGLGVFVFVGLVVAGPTMRNTFETAVKDTNLQDVEILNAGGFLDEDIKKIKSQDGLKDVEFFYDIDVVEEENKGVFKIINLPEKIAHPIIVEGRAPVNTEEILLDRSVQSDGYKIGDTISFAKEIDKFNIEKSEDSTLKNYTYTVVGFCDTPNYATNYFRGVSQRGLGEIKHFAYVVKDVFMRDSYTIARLTYEDLEGLNTYSGKYKKRVKKHVDELKIDFKYTPAQRLEENRVKISDSVSEGEKKISDAKEEINDARDKILEGKSELKDGENKYREGLNTFNEEVKKGEEKLQDSKKTLDENKKKLTDSEKELADGKEKLDDGKSEIESGKIKLKESEAKFLEGKLKYDQGKATLEATEKTLADAKKQLDEGLIKLQEGRAKLNETKKTLDESKAKIDAGEAEIAANQKKIDEGFEEVKKGLAGTGIYEEGDSIDQVLGKVEGIDSLLSKIPDDIGDVDSQIADLKSKVDAANARIAEIDTLLQDPNTTEEEKAALEAEKQNLNTQITLLQTQISALESVKSAVDDLKNKYPALKDFSIGEIKSKVGELKSGLQKLSEGQRQIDEAKANLEKGKGQYEAGLKAYEEGLKQAEEGERTYEENLRKYEEGLRQFEEGKRKLKDSEIKLSEGKKKLDEGREKLSKGEAEYNENLNKYNEGKAKLEAGKIALESGEKQYEEGLKEFNEETSKGRGKLSTSKRKLNKARYDLKDAEETFDEESKKALDEIEKGEVDIRDAKRILKILEKPQYEIISRDKNFSVDMYLDYSKRLDLLSAVFPIFFFSIAMLVCFTTMRRMVEEERIEIGTHKALGYSKKYIMKKYFGYGTLAATIGGIIGAIFGQLIITKLVANSYSANTIFQDKLIMKLYLGWYILAIAIGILCTGVTAIVTVYSTLQENTATLLRGKPPKSGMRIFLERIDPVWTRMNFFQKVTARNLFRYKGRMMMTIIGILGCVALLMLGFGLKGSVLHISSRQFNEIFKYDAGVIYNKDINPEAFYEYTNYLNNNKDVKSYREYLQKIVNFDYKGRDQSITMIVPKDKDEISNEIEIRKRRGGAIEIPEKGIIITEKLKKITGVKVGDTLKVSDAFGEEYKLMVAGYCENYMGHNIYMSKEYYERIFGEEFKPNLDLVTFDTEDMNVHKSIKSKIIDYKCVLSVTDTNLQKTAMSQFETALSLVELVITFASVMLALIVLYNLTNINIEERKREISTLKVLGFNNDESIKYIYREAWVLTAIGIVIGLIAGKILHYLVISVVTPPNVMLDPTLVFRSYLIATIITILITLITRIIFYFKVKKINMVEALKAVE